MIELDNQDYDLQPLRRRKDSGRKRGVGRILFRVILSLAVIEAVWLLIANLSVKPVVAQWGVIEKGCWAEALFLRSETVVTVPANGRFVVKVPSGTRVPRGEILAYIQSGDSGNPQTETHPGTGSLDDLKQAQKLIGENEELKADLKRMTDQMERRLADTKKIGVQKTNEELTVFLKEKNRILRTIQENDDQVKRLNSGMSAMPSGAVIVTAGQAGYWFTEIDGWESKLNPDYFKTLRTDEFRKSYPLKTPNASLSAGTVCGKIVNPFSQLIAVEVDPRQTGNLYKESTLKMVIENESFPVILKDEVHLPNGKIILGLEDTAMKIRQPNRRNRVYLIYQKTSGITLPVQALYKKGKDTYVKIVEGVGFKAENIQVLASDGERAVVKGIDFGTTVYSR